MRRDHAVILDHFRPKTDHGIDFKGLHSSNDEFSTQVTKKAKKFAMRLQ